MNLNHRRQSFLRRLWCNNWSTHLGWVSSVSGSLVFILDQMGKVLNNDGVKSAISDLHLDPKIMLVIAIMGVLTLVSVEH